MLTKAGAEGVMLTGANTKGGMPGALFGSAAVVGATATGAVASVAVRVAAATAGVVATAALTSFCAEALAVGLAADFAGVFFTALYFLPFHSKVSLPALRAAEKASLKVEGAFTSAAKAG